MTVDENDLVDTDFKKLWRIHCWKRYVPYELQERWDRLGIEARQCIYLMAKEQSDAEEWD